MATMVFSRTNRNVWFLFLVLLCLIIAVFYSLDNRRSEVEFERGIKSLVVRLVPDVLLAPGLPLEVQWHTDRIQWLRINDAYQPNFGVIDMPVGICQPVVVQFRSGPLTIDSVPLMPSIVTDDIANIALALPGLVPLVLLALYNSVMTAGQKAWLRSRVTARRMALVRFVLFGSVVMLARYAFVQSCSMTMLDLASAVPVSVAVYLLWFFVGIGLLVLSLVRVSALRDILKLIAGLPLSLLGALLGVSSALLLILAGTWARDNSLLMVLPFLLWTVEMPLGAFYFVIRSANNEQSRLAFHWTRQPRYVWVIVAVVLWTLFWRAPWQTLLASFSWVAVAMGLGLFLLPGIFIQQWFYRDVPFSPTRAISIGFCISIAVTAFLGLCALALQQPIGFVINGLFLIGGTALVLLIWQGRWASPSEAPDKYSFSSWLILILGFVAITGIATIVYSRESRRGADYHSYDAYVTEYASGDPFGLQEVLGGTGNNAPFRFWLALWPVSHAVITDLSGLHILIVGTLLKVFLVYIALVAVYELALALGFSTLEASIAVLLQCLCLLMLVKQNEAGHVFLARLDQDKVLAAFIIGPVLFRVLIDFYAKAKMGVLLLLLFFANTFTHSTMLAINASIVGGYSLLELFVSRRMNRALLALALLVICVGIYIPFRMLDRNYSYSVDDGSGGTIQNEVQLGRISVLPNPRFYGIALQLVDGPVFLMAGLAGILAVPKLRSSKAARYIFVSALVLAFAIIPYTGWIIGLVITPFHLWRIPWTFPFGIAAIFVLNVVRQLGSRFMRPPEGASTSNILASLSIPVSMMLIVLGFSLWLGDRYERDVINTDDTDEQDVVAIPLPDMAHLGAFLDAHVGEDELVMAYPESLSQYVPTLSGHTKTLLVRAANVMARQTGMPLATIEQRYSDYEKIADPQVPLEERLNLLQAYEVTLVIVYGDNNPFKEMMAQSPHQLCSLGKVDSFVVYRFNFDGCTTDSSATSAGQ